MVNQNDSHDQGQQTPREDRRMREYTGAFNLRLYVKVLARDEDDAMRQLAVMDMNAAIEQSYAYELLQDDEQPPRYFFIQQQPLEFGDDGEGGDA